MRQVTEVQLGGPQPLPYPHPVAKPHCDSRPHDCQPPTSAPSPIPRALVPACCLSPVFPPQNSLCASQRCCPEPRAAVSVHNAVVHFCPLPLVCGLLSRMFAWAVRLSVWHSVSLHDWLSFAFTRASSVAVVVAAAGVWAGDPEQSPAPRCSISVALPPLCCSRHGTSRW